MLEALIYFSHQPIIFHLIKLPIIRYEQLSWIAYLTACFEFWVKKSITWKKFIFDIRSYCVPNRLVLYNGIKWKTFHFTIFNCCITKSSYFLCGCCNCTDPMGSDEKTILHWKPQFWLCHNPLNQISITLLNTSIHDIPFFQMNSSWVLWIGNPLKSHILAQ